MNRSDSLRILAEWAGRRKSPFPHQPALCSLNERNATRHGANAVRAIHQNIGALAGTVVPSTDYCMREARLAFRCALNAVGLGRNL